MVEFAGKTGYFPVHTLLFRVLHTTAWYRLPESYLWWKGLGEIPVSLVIFKHYQTMMPTKSELMRYWSLASRKWL